MLKATLAERLGRVTAAEARRTEHDEHLWIEYPRRSGGSPEETAVERALRRVGLRDCTSLLRTLPEPRRGAWCAMHWREVGGTLDMPKRCDPWPQAEHTLVTAPMVRAFTRADCGCSA